MSVDIPDPPLSPTALAAFRDGIARLRAKDLHGALASLNRALAATGDHPDILTALADVAAQGGDLASAEKILRHLRARWPGPGVDARLARVLYRKQQFAETAAILTPLLAGRQPDSGLHGILASALECVGEFDRALSLEAMLYDAFPTAERAASLMAAYFRQARHDELAARTPALLARHPQEASLQATAAVLALGLGDFPTGFARMAERQRLLGVTHTDARVAALPAWDGSSFDGTLLVTLEPMIGDELLMSQLLATLDRRVSRVVVEVDPRCLALYRRSFPSFTFVDRRTQALGDAIVSGADCRRAMTIDMLLASGRTWTLPGTPGWLRADPARVAAKRAEYAQRFPGQRLVGISWRSRQAINDMDLKSVPLAALSRSLSVPGIAFIDLQYGDVRKEVDALAGALRPWRDPDIDPFHDIEGVAAQLACCERLVGVSNATAHLAGGLGTPATVLLPKRFPVLWHWGYRGTETTWYGSVRLLRNPCEHGGGWADADAALAADLALPTDAARLAGPDSRLAGVG